MNPTVKFIGCAGWNIPNEEKAQFPPFGTHLERYATHFATVEINSSFYRPHKIATYARWADTVPVDFRFAIKCPKTITHGARLENTQELLAKFLDEVSGLGDKLGCLLVQLPPSLTFELIVASEFFENLRNMTKVRVALEPRHSTWSSKHVEKENTELKKLLADQMLKARALEIALEKKA
ncbi:MAG: DUF72 domain-containing protein [Chthoniobacterales bacterium]